MDDLALMSYCIDFINKVEGNDDLQLWYVSQMLEDSSVDNFVYILEAYAGTVPAAYIRSLTQEVISEMMKKEVHAKKNWSNN